MKKILLSTFFIFLNLGLLIDVSSKPKKKDVIYGLTNEYSDRLKKSIELLQLNYSLKHYIYYSGREKFFNWTINNDPKYLDVKKYKSKIKLIHNSKNTFEEIQNIEKEIKKRNINSAIIVTDPPHTLRVKIFIELFTTKLKKDYIIVSSEPTWWNKYLYFTNWYAIKFVFLELIKIPYNLIKYGLILS